MGFSLFLNLIDFFLFTQNGYNNFHVSEGLFIVVVLPILS